MKNVRIILFSAFVGSCTHQPKVLPEDSCTEILSKGRDLKQTEALNLVSHLYRAKCYKEVITWTEKVHAAYEHKEYSLWRETTELFIPEGTVTDYVLESYERAYLRFLTAASFLKLQNRQGALVELRRYYNEETAKNYNHGVDPVNALLQAAMWDIIAEPEFSSRPFWLRLSRDQDADPKTSAFAMEQIKSIDAKEVRPKWEIFQVGDFPLISWKINFVSAKDGYIEMKLRTPFPDRCREHQEILFDTKSWYSKIATRHSNSYHPLVNAKSWLRTPVAAVYFLTTVSAGAGIMVGGCALSMKAEDAAFCNLSIQGGLAVMSLSDDIVTQTLKPDLRYWEEVPAAILVRAPDDHRQSKCLKKSAGFNHARLL
jgi:hypothetical protein